MGTGQNAKGYVPILHSLAFIEKKQYNITAMEKLKNILLNVLNENFISAILSNPRDKEQAAKVKVRPVRMKETLLFQIEVFRGNQAFHENLEAAKACDRLLALMENMKQLQLETCDASYSVLVSKKGKMTIKKKENRTPKKKVELTHNRQKQYILQEGTAVPFLQDLGVMTADGKIVHSKFDKFKQINRFLEFIEDILPRLDKGRELTILDFGCGKSYLTFAMYYYLHEMKEYDIRIIGLDLKTEVIRHCNELAVKYGYEKLKFLEGNIAEYTGVEEVDMVVTLHACDTATDFALAKAIGWKAKVILSVPCCQHELNRQIHSDILMPVMKYGLLKERMAALVTDGLRAEYLERAGYEVQVLEFIDMEHTPKNILLRAVKGERSCEAVREEIHACEEFLHVTPMLGRLLDTREVDS